MNVRSELTDHVRSATTASRFPAWPPQLDIQAATAGRIVELVCDRPAVIRLAPADLQRVRGQIQSMAEQLNIAAGKSALSEEPPARLTDYLGVISDVFAGPDRHAPWITGSASRHLKQALAAEEFIRAHIREEIPIVRLCKAVAVSRRQLEYAFRATFGVSPLEFIKALRLNEARRLLATARNSGMSVTTIAMDLGISHLGRFAAHYHLLFGERPGQTLLRGDRSARSRIG